MLSDGVGPRIRWRGSTVQDLDPALSNLARRDTQIVGSLPGTDMYQILLVPFGQPLLISTSMSCAEIGWPFC